jgi:hypothetical protein
MEMQKVWTLTEQLRDSYSRSRVEGNGGIIMDEISKHAVLRLMNLKKGQSKLMKTVEGMKDLVPAMVYDALIGEVELIDVEIKSLCRMVDDSVTTFNRSRIKR